MVLTAPEFVVAEPVELLDEVEITAELEQRVFADRVMRSEESAEIQTRHDGSSWVLSGTIEWRTVGEISHMAKSRGR
jgi:hypothetical protein